MQALQRKPIRTYIVLLLTFLLLILLNFLVVSYQDVVQKSDVSYLKKNCLPVSRVSEQAAEHIVVDKSLFGAIYIFSHYADEGSASDFEAARRPIWTELLCFPVVGCLIPPSTSPKCQAN